MAADNSYSRLVAWLKVILPLAALAILSSLFLVSRGLHTIGATAGSDAGVSDRLREPRLTEPIFTGMTGDGAAVTVTAKEIRPRPGSLTEGTARQLTVLMEAVSGTVTTLEAETGWMNTETDNVVLGGGVTVTTSSGYRLTAPDMEGSIRQTDLLASGGVSGKSPFGPLTSHTMRVTPDPAAPGNHLVDFNGDVRLIYRPKR